jgi:ABC-2 type transport system permease protein
MRSSHLANIYRLGIKEFWSLIRDPIMLVLIAYAFSFQVYVAATGIPDRISRIPIAVVDEDDSALSGRIVAALQPPEFLPPQRVMLDEVDAGLNDGLFTFSIDIPPNFQRDVLAGRSPAVQLNVDATRMGQAFTGSAYAQQVILGEVNEFVQRYRSVPQLPVDLALRVRFNPALTQSWFGSLMEIINNVTMLSIVLAGAALIREREHGTVEHLLVMPVTPSEIMLGKIWSMGVVVLLATAFSLHFIVQGALHVPIEGSVSLFLAIAALHLFVTTSMGIFMGTIARSMPQFGLLMMLVLLPMQMLSGGSTPRESMPKLAQDIMEFAPTTHFVAASQAILYRGGGFSVVWPQIVALCIIGAAFFICSLAYFRKSIMHMA